MSLAKAFKMLKERLEGELYSDNLHKVLYATDASVYRKLPQAVAFPKNKEDIKQLILFAKKHKTSLIPRTAGTSLAGQCVGEGIVVDVSKYFTRILNIDESHKTVTVQPGVIRDELNDYLKPFRLFFGPNTSTSNRCMIGGMVGNNSSGTTSIKYGVTRDKIFQLKTLLSDGTEVVFNAISTDEYKKKMQLPSLEGHVYKTIYSELSSEEAQQSIIENFPKQDIHRRNTGYAVDELIKSTIFEGDQEFNMCKLLAGSEGTLAFTTEITLLLDDFPPPINMMIVVHFESINNCLDAIEMLMKHDLHTCEMLDKTILDLTKHNKTQQENRSFIQGDPAAIVMCEIKGHKKSETHAKIEALLKNMQDSGLSYANIVLEGETIDKAMALRKAGLGLLGNMIGDKKAVACIEDTAVALADLSHYISDFTKLMKDFGQEAVYYAHAGAGELHLRPILNLKTSHDVTLFKEITQAVAKLVKSYKGSFSGEHGDGIVRSGCIELMIGSDNYNVLKRIKSAFDPSNIFNPGKIVDSYQMTDNLRYTPDRKEPKVTTIMDFSASEGILREAEKCNGSGDCRKLPVSGGTMCPSYHATRNEKDTTRARANAIREFLTHSNRSNKFDHGELKEVFDLCLSCKACASECPSSVDVASLKAEFLYQYQKANGFSFRDKFFAEATKYNIRASKMSSLANIITQNKLSSSLLKKIYGIANKRSLPRVSRQTFSNWYKTKNRIEYEYPTKSVCLFVDEFTNYLESEIAQDALQLLEKLNYDVIIVDHLDSGRSYISKGFLNESKYLINKNIDYITKSISLGIPILGIEPSTILTFKDEALKLADDKTTARQVAERSFLIEEFLYHEMKRGHISEDQFTTASKDIHFHGHCHQKALSDQNYTAELLSLPKNYQVSIIPSGCCGMAGSFGYEKEHYNVSMQVGEQVLFPYLKALNNDVLIAANGTSCRHQIKDGVQRKALHPVTILREALLI